MGVEQSVEEGENQWWERSSPQYCGSVFLDDTRGIFSGHIDELEVAYTLCTLDELPFPQHTFNAATSTISEEESLQHELSDYYRDCQWLENSPHHLYPLEPDITRADDRDEDFMSTRSRFSKTTFYTASSGTGSHQRPINTKHLQR